jgi:hypothetical protein
MRLGLPPFDDQYEVVSALTPIGVALTSQQSLGQEIVFARFDRQLWEVALRAEIRAWPGCRRCQSTDRVSSSTVEMASTAQFARSITRQLLVSGVAWHARRTVDRRFVAASSRRTVVVLRVRAHCTVRNSLILRFFAAFAKKPLAALPGLTPCPLVQVRANALHGSLPWQGSRPGARLCQSTELPALLMYPL